MNKHFELISKYCEVVEVVGDNAIYYKEHGVGYAEINGADFLCDSVDEFHELVEMFGEGGIGEQPRPAARRPKAPQAQEKKRERAVDKTRVMCYNNNVERIE